MLSPADIARFRVSLLEWYSRHKRDLPWRKTRDPYAIWISEIMLQQTRVAAVIPYYQRFLDRFPTFQSLAEASEADLLSHWAGLGYYYRARNLQKAAQIMTQTAGFPTTYHEFLALPGIGEYTAAAVASIGFNLPHAVVDGNVFRVISRICNDSTNVASGSARKHFGQLAKTLLDPARPGAFNQAVMELGATVCLPRNPQCLVCPVAELCQARAQGTQETLPVKTKPRKTVTIERVLYWIERAGSILLWQRPPHSRLMPGFWELPEQEQLPEAKPGRILAKFRHGITFHDYRFTVVEAELTGQIDSCKWVSSTELLHLPQSSVLKKARRAIRRLTPESGTEEQALTSLG